MIDALPNRATMVDVHRFLASLLAALAVVGARRSAHRVASERRARVARRRRRRDELVVAGQRRGATELPVDRAAEVRGGGVPRRAPAPRGGLRATGGVDGHLDHAATLIEDAAERRLSGRQRHDQRLGDHRRRRAAAESARLARASGELFRRQRWAGVGRRGVDQHGCGGVDHHRRRGVGRRRPRRALAGQQAEREEPRAAHRRDFTTAPGAAPRHSSLM